MNSFTEYASVLIPLIVNGVIAAYLFGGVSQKIKALEADIMKMQLDMQKVRDANDRSEGNLHRVELVLSRIEARFDMFLVAASDRTRCPLLREQAKVAGSDERPQDHPAL